MVMSKLSKEERDLVTSVESGEWKSVKNSDKEKKRYITIARDTLKKDKRINIRISAHTLEGLQMKAVREGIPYQTLIASVLHKYVSGYLISI